MTTLTLAYNVSYNLCQPWY